MPSEISVGAVLVKYGVEYRAIVDTDGTMSIGRIDGDEYFYNFAAKNFGLPHETGALTTENVNYCFNRLKPVIDRLEYGFWEISLYCMENEIAPVTQTDIDNGYTQALHDEIIADINAYLGN